MKLNLWLVGLYIFIVIQLNPTLIWKDIQLTWIKLSITWTQCQTAALKWHTAKQQCKIDQLNERIAALKQAQ